MAKSNTGAKVAKGKMQSTWLSNALKSVGAASTDVIKEMFPATSETVGSVTKTATDLAVTIRQGRTGNRTVMNALKQNPVIKMGQDFFKNAVDEIKTGEIYRGNNAGGGLGEGNAFEGPSSDDVSFGDIGDEGGNSPDITIQNTTIEKSDNNASIKAMQKTTELVVKSTKQAVDTMVTIGSNSMMQNASISKEAMGYLSSIDNNIKTLLEFANSNMKQYFDASIAFYQGQNKAAEAASGGVEDTKVTQDTIFGANGGFDIRQYASYVKQNAKEAIANEGVGAVVQTILEYKDQFISDPIGIITKGLISGIVPEVTKKAALYFDNSLKNFIPSVLERLGDLGDDPNSSTAVAFISRVFGIKGERRTKFDFSNIKKNEPVPYNGIANHTIVEIIPTYLRESNAYLKAIAEAVTGKSASSMNANSQMFDWNTGTFKDLKELQYNAFKQIADAETGEVLNSDFGRFMLKQKEKLTNEDDKANFEEAFKEVIMMMTGHNGQIDFSNEEFLNGFVSRLDDRYSGSIKSLISAGLGAVATDGRLNGSASQSVRSGKSAANRMIKQANESAAANGITGLYSNNDYLKFRDKMVKEKDDEDSNRIAPNSSVRNRGLKGVVENANASIDGVITATTGRKTGVESWLENIYNLLDRGIYVEMKRNVVTRAKRESANSAASPTPTAEQAEQINASVVTKTAEEYKAEMLNELELELNQRDTDTNIQDGDSVRTIAGKRSARLLNYMGDVLNGILSGNADAAWDKLTNVFTDYVKKAGDFVSEHFLDPIKKQLFGSKNEDGYNEGGILGGVSNTGRELFFSLRRMVTGAGYTKADGTVIEDASGDELNDTIIGKVKNLVKDIKDGISVRLFGEKDEEGNVTKEGLVGKAKGKFGEVTNSLLEGLHNWKIALFGESDDPEDGPEKTWETIKEKAKKFVPAGIFAILAGRGIASTVGGILGNLSLGPAGALIGLGAAVASQSDKFKDWLFGPEGDQGRIGGIISQKTQEFFKTNKKFITGGAALGAITGFFTKGGLLGTLVGGPVAGALMGLGSSILVKSDMFHKFLFGDEETGRVGLLKTVKGMFGKFGKNMNPDTKTAGMLGAGAAAGAITMGALTSTGILGLSFGIGGPIGGALVGLGASILAQKENFKEWLFGTTDDEGNRKEGFLGKFRNMLLVKLINPMITGAKSIGRDFKSFLYYDIFDKFNLIIKPVGDAIFGTLSNITGKAMSSVAQVAEYIRTDFLDSFVEKTAAFLEPVKAAGGAMVKAIYGAGKAIAKAPLDILYAMTNPIFTAVNKVFTTAITTTFKTIDNVIVKPVKNLVIKPLAKITETAFKVVTTPFKILNDAVIRISDGMNQKFAQISRFFGLIGENIKDSIHKAVFENPLSQGIKKLFNKASEFKDHVINFSKMAMEPVREVVTATINEVKKTVKDTVGKMMHGILTALNPLNWVRAISSLFTGEKPAKTENRTGLFGYLKNTWDRAKAGVEPRRDASKMSYSDLRRAHRRDRLYAKKRTYYVNEETGERYLETEDGGYLNEQTNQKLSRRDFNKLPGREGFKLETVGEDGKVEVRRKNSIDKQRDYNRNLIAKWTGYQQTQDTAANRALAMAEARKKGKPLHFKDIAYEETIEEKNAKILAEQHDAVIEGNVTEKETLNVLVEIKDHLLSWMGDEDAKSRIQARKDERERRKVRNATIMEDLPQDPNDIIAAGEENAAIAGSARASGADNADDIIAKTKANRAAHLARLMSKETNKKGFFGRLGDTIKYRSAVFKSEWDTYRSEYDKKKALEEASAVIENLPHHAEGTPSAGKGLAVVGERGPELVNFNGGEEVTNHASTRGLFTTIHESLDDNFSKLFDKIDMVVDNMIHLREEHKEDPSFRGVLKQAMEDPYKLADIFEHPLASAFATILGVAIPKASKAINDKVIPWVNSKIRRASSGDGLTDELDLMGGDLGDLPHFAEGTDSAKPGLAVVGEQGPELVQLNGGERVVPNESTMGILYNAMADIKEIITAPFQAFREVVSDAITTVKTKVAEFGEHVVEFLKHNPITDFVREQKNRLKDTLKQVFAPLHELKDHIKAVIIEDIKAGIMAPFKAIAAPFKLLGKGIGKVKNALGIESLGIFDKFKEAWDKTDPAKKKEREAQAQTKPVVEAIDEKASATIDKMEGINTNVEKVISAVEALAPEIAKSLKPEMESISPTMESIALPSLAGLSPAGGANAGISMPSISAEGNIGDALAQASVSGLTAANMKAKMAEEKEVNTDNARDESRNTLLTEIRDKLGSHHKTWDSIFSKKGLITAGLIMLAPLAIKAIKKILSLFNPNDDGGGGGGGGQSLASKVLNATIHTVERIFGDKQFLEETGGLGDGRSTKEATADEVADLKESVAQLLDGNVGGALNTFLFDENGTVNNSTGARAKWLAHLAANTTAKGVGIYSGIKAGEVGTTLAHTLTPQGNKALAKEGSKTMVTVGKDMMKNGFNLAKGAGGIDDITKGAMAAIGKAKTGEEAAKLTRGLAKDLTRAGASPETIAKATAAAEAAGKKALAKGSMQVDDITRFSTKFLDDIAKAIRKATGKDISQAIAKISPKITEGIAKNLPAISRRVAGVLEMTAGLAVTGVGLLAKESTWIVLGACNGLSGAQRLFKTDQSPDFLMLKISSAFGAFTGSTVGMIMDIINEIIVTTTGQDIFYLLACAIYEIIAGSEKAEALMKSQEEFKEQYKTDTIEELRKQYTALLKTNNISSDVSEEEFIKMAQSGEAAAHIQSFANYNDEQHKTWGAKLWDKTIDPMMERVFGRTVNKYTDANGVHYEENRDGTYQAYDANGNDLGYVHKDYVVNNATLDHTSGVSEKTSAYGENWQAGKHMIQDWYENKWTPAAGNAMLATGDFFKNFGSYWKSGLGINDKKTTPVDTSELAGRLSELPAGNAQPMTKKNYAKSFVDNWKSGYDQIGNAVGDAALAAQNKASGVVDAIKNSEGVATAKMFFEDIATYARFTGDQISNWWQTNVVDKATESIEFWASKISPIVDSAKEWWGEFSGSIKNGFRVMKEAVAEYVAPMIDGIKSAAKSVKDFITPIAQGLVDAWNVVKESAAKQWEVVSETAQRMGEHISALWGDIKTDVGNKVQDIADGVQEHWNTIADGAKGMARHVADAWGDTKTNVSNWWDGVTTGFGEGLLSMGEHVTKFIDKIVEVKNKIGDFLGSFNPFKSTGDKSKVGLSDIFKSFDFHQGAESLRASGYARGTGYAASGYTLVGEKGPEIVRLNGGEKIYTADETKSILGGHGTGDLAAAIREQISSNMTAVASVPMNAMRTAGNTLHSTTSNMASAIGTNYNKLTKAADNMAKMASSGSIDKLWNTKAEFNSADPLSGLWSGISNVNRIMYTAVGAVPNMLGKVGEIAGAITTSLKSKVSAISNFINSKVSMVTSGGRGYFRGGRGSVAGSAISDALSRAGDRQISSGMIDSILSGVSDPNQLLETDAISNIGKKYGIEVTKYPNPSAHTISSMIDEGNPILLYGIDDTAGNSSPYTKSGHFITSQHIDPLRNTMSITDPRYGSKQVKYPEKSVYDSTRYMWGFHRKPKKLPNVPTVFKGGRGVWRNRNLIIRGGRGYVEGIPTEMNPNAGDKERMLAKCNSYMGQSGSHFFSVWGMTTHWCAMFISTCARESGNDKIIPWDSSCSSQVKWWKANNRWVDKGSPQVGDIVYFDWDQPTPQNDSGYPDRIYDHVGIVAKVNGSKITTIEGNTGGDAPSGTSVNSYTYDTSDINVMGYGRPAYGDSNWVPGSSTTTSTTVTGGTDNSLLSALSTNIGVLASEAFDAAITGNTKIDWENKFQKYEPYATPSSDSTKTTTSSSDSSAMSLSDKLNVAANLTDSKLVKTAATVANAVENAKSGGSGGRGAYFSQNDPAWKNTKLIRSDGTDDGSTMGNSGCGPTAMAMALSDSVGRVIDPITLANYSKAAGFSDETGTNWDFMNSAANKFGVATSQIIEPSARDLKQAMSLGTPVVLSGVSDDSSTYTTAGHYVVAEGMDKNGNVLIKDPRGRSYNKKMNVSDLEGETTSAWAMLPGGRGTFKKLGKKFWNMFRGGRGDGEIIVQAMREAISYLGKSDWYPRTAGGLLRATLMKANFPADYYQNITETGYNKTLAKLGKDTDRITLYSRGTDVFNNNKMAHASGDVGLRRGDIVVSHSIPAVFLQYVTNGGKSGAEVVRFDDAVNHGINSTTIWYEEKGNTKVRVYRYSRKPQTNKTSTTTSNTSSFDTSELNDLMSSLGDTSSFGDMNFSNIMSNGVFGSILGENSVWSKVTSKLGKFATAAYEAAATGNFNINWDKVFAEQQEATTSTSSASTYSGASLTGNDNMEKIYNYLRGKGYTPEGTAGVMGNLRAESGLIPNNLQNSYERSLGYSDESYTSAVDSGNYSRDKFIHDAAGYGLAQWTYWDRKQNLYDFVKGSGASIGDLGAQLAFLDKELSEKYSMLKSTNSLKEASNIILHKFENPADQSASVENYRASLGQEVYNAMGGKGNGPKITGYNPAPYEIRNRRGGKGVKVTGIYIPKRRYATSGRGIGDTASYAGYGIEPVDVTMQTTRSYTPYSTYSYRNGTDVDRIESMMVQMVNALNSISSDSKNLAMLKDINNGIASAGSLSTTHNSVTNNIITGGKGDDTKPVVKQTRKTSTGINPTMS